MVFFHMQSLGNMRVKNDLKSTLRQKTHVLSINPTQAEFSMKKSQFTEKNTQFFEKTLIRSWMVMNTSSSHKHYKV